MANDTKDKRPPTKPPRHLSYEIDARIDVKISYDLAIELGEHLEKFPPDNPALLGLTKGLLALQPKDEEEPV